MKVENADPRVIQTYARYTSQEARDGEGSAGVHDNEAPIPLEDAYATLLHDREMKHVLLDILYSMVYFSLFVAMLFSHIPASNTLYELGYSVSSTLASSGSDTVTSDSTIKFTNIQTIGDTFDWLTDTFVPSVFVTEDYNGDLLQKDKWGRVAMFNKVLGAVMFETKRAMVHPCQAQQYLLDLYPNCYDPKNVVNDTKLVSFDTNATEATDLISKSKLNGTWLDFSTQSLVITIVAYNGEIQAYTVTELILEFHQGGYVEPSVSTTPAIADPYKNANILALDVLVGLCWLAAMVRYTITTFRQLREVRAQYRDSVNRATSRSGIFHLLCVQYELISVVLFNFTVKYLAQFPVAFFYVPWYLIVSLMTERTFRDNLARLVVTGKKFDVNSDERNGLIAVTDSLKNVASWTILLRAIAVFAVILLGLRILKSFHAHPHLGVLTRTIASALHQFRWVFVVFIIVILTFSVAGTVLFGDRVEGFSSMGKSLETCINMLFGSFDYSTIQNVYPPASMLFYWAYMIIVSLVLLNMMLAIVVDAYVEVSSEKNRVPKNTSTTRVLKNIASDILQSPLSTMFRTESSNGGQSHWATLIHGKAGSRTATSGDILAHYRALSADEVVSRGMVKPHLLLKLLESFCASESGGRKSGATLKNPRSSSLTAKTLQDWFSSAQLPDVVVNETMSFIREGMGEASMHQTDAQDTTKPSRRWSKAEETRMVMEASSISDLSSVGPEDVRLRKETAASSNQPDEGIASLSEVEARDNNDDDVRSQIALLLKQMGDMQRKMDLLLSKTSEA
ncbi:unnamed protein product [Globisporangium polare]